MQNLQARDGDVCFDGWQLRKDRGELWRDGFKVAIQELPLLLLGELLARPGELVTRQHLIGRLWPNRVVEFDTGLNTAVKKLRSVLDDDSNQPRYIETVPRKGYRFIGKLDAPDAAVPPGRRTSEHAASRRRLAPLLGSLAAGLALALVVLVWPPSGSNAPAAETALTTNAEAFDLYLRAKERIAQIMPNEPELGRSGNAAPRAQVLAWVDEALRLDPTFALAYVLRARVHLDFFISNLDVSEERLSSVRADLERARRIARDETLGSDVRGLYAAFVDVEPERGLRELGYGEPTSDPAVAMNQARVLTSMARFRDSDALLQRLLVDAPADQLALRMSVSNLASEGRTADLFRVVQRLREVSPPQTDMRAWTYFSSGTPVSVNAEALLGAVAAAPDDVASERLFAGSFELTALRHAGRYADVRRILDATRARSLRFGSFIGASPGLGERPVAELRGWNELLLGNAAAAVVHGRELLQFVESQRATPSNKWVLQILRAEGRLFAGDHVAAIGAVREAMREAPLLRQVEAHRAYLAATVLAWAGARDEAVSLLAELVTSGSPRIGPVRIAREPLITVPLRGNPRFEALTASLENELRKNQLLEQRLTPPLEDFY